MCQLRLSFGELAAFWSLVGLNCWSSGHMFWPQVWLLVAWSAHYAMSNFITITQYFFFNDHIKYPISGIITNISLSFKPMPGVIVIIS